MNEKEQNSELIDDGLSQYIKEREAIDDFCNAEKRYETLLSFEKIDDGYRILEGDNEKGTRKSYLNENQELVGFDFTPLERYEEVFKFRKDSRDRYWLLERDSKKGDRETVFDSYGNRKMEKCYPLCGN